MSLGNGFAAGLAQGQQFTRGIFDAYRAGQQMNDAREQAEQKEALKGIASAKAVESTGYTADQGKELEGLAANGYKIDFDQANNAYVARNDAGDTKTIAMQGVTDFMGERTAGSMSQEQQDGTRISAMADVISRTDPARGLRLRSQLQQDQHAAKRSARDEKVWAKEDSIDAIDQEMGAALKASMVDKDGKQVQATPDMYLDNIQQRAARLAQAGHSKQAQESMQQFYGMADVKIRHDARQREQDAAPAMAAFQSGNTQPIVDYYNKYVPGGSKISSIERGKDGGYVVNAMGANGQAIPTRKLDERGMMAMVQGLNDPKSLLQHAWDEANYALRLRGEARADRGEARAERGERRAEAAHGAVMADRQERRNDRLELRSVREALARESNPGISDTQVRGIRAGLLPTPGAENPKAKYDYDPVKVQKAFGETIPARVPGEKDTVKRDLAKEQRFQEFMADNPNIRDVDEALVKFNAADVKRGRSEKASRASAVQGAMSPETIAATAKKYGMTEDQVRDQLRSQGLIK